MPTKSSTYYALMLVIALSAVAVDISIPAIATTVEQLGAQARQGHYIIMMYVLAYALAQIPVGLLADRYGRRPVLFAGLLIFTVAGVVTTFTNDIETLIFWRFIQGIGGSVGPVLARTIARDLFSGKELARVFSTLMSMIAFLTMIAPFLGSVLMLIFGWRAVYASTVIIGVITTVVVYFFVPETLSEKRANTNVGDQLRFSFNAILKTPSAMWASSMVSLNFFGYMSMVASFSIVANSVYGLNSFVTGGIFTSGVLIYFLSSIVSRKMVLTEEPRKLIRISASMYLIAACLFIILIFNQPVPLWFFCSSFIPFLIAFGFMFANGTTMSLEPLPDSAGFAAGIFGSIQMGMGALGAFLTSVFYDGTATSLIAVMIAASLLSSSIYFVGNRSIEHDPQTYR